MWMWANDRHIITPADAAAVFYIGRAWNSNSQVWSTVTDTVMAPASITTKRRILRSADIRILTPAEAIRCGIRALIMCLPDPMRTGDILMIKDDVQSSIHTINWIGEAPIGAGIQWRIHLNALLAGDIVSISCGYEE